MIIMDYGAYTRLDLNAFRTFQEDEDDLLKRQRPPSFFYILPLIPIFL